MENMKHDVGEEKGEGDQRNTVQKDIVLHIHSIRHVMSTRIVPATEKNLEEKHGEMGK